MEALFSMHQMRNIGMYVTDSRVLTYGYDGLIIVRDNIELHKVIAIFMPHHRRQGGIKCAISSRFGETIISLGRNGDLVASRVRYFAFICFLHSRILKLLRKIIYMIYFNYASSLSETKINLAESRDVSVHLSIEDFASGPNELYGLAGETWLDNVIATKLKAERDEALPLRASIIADLEKIKNQVYYFFSEFNILELRYTYDLKKIFNRYASFLIKMKANHRMLDCRSRFLI